MRTLFASATGITARMKVVNDFQICSSRTPGRTNMAVCSATARSNSRVSAFPRAFRRGLIEARRRLVLDVGHVRIGRIVDSRAAQIGEIGLILFDLLFHSGQTEHQRGIAVEIGSSRCCIPRRRLPPASSVSGSSIRRSCSRNVVQIETASMPASRNSARVIFRGPVREKRAELDAGWSFRLRRKGQQAAARHGHTWPHQEFSSFDRHRNLAPIRKAAAGQIECCGFRRLR